MDATTAVVKLHELDPAFRSICEALYPGLDPREVASEVYKSEPSSSDLSPNTGIGARDDKQWRNGRGDTKGRGRRKIDVDVKRTVHKKSDVDLPRNMSRLPAALKKTKTEGDVSAGTKASVRVVRQYSKPYRGVGKLHTTLPDQPHPGSNQSRERKIALAGLGAGGVATVGGLHALALQGGKTKHLLRTKSGKAALAGAGAWGLLHATELTGDVLGLRAQRRAYQANKPKVNKAWAQAQTQIVDAVRNGTISKVQAMRLGEEVLAQLTAAATVVVRQEKVGKAHIPPPPDWLMGRKAELAAGGVGIAAGAGLSYRHQKKKQAKVAKSFGDMGGAPTSANISLKSLKAPAPVKADAPHLTPSTINPPKPAKSGAGRKAGKPKVSKSVEATGEIAKFDVDKQQCFGWCSVVKLDGRDIVDKQSDLIAVADLEDAAYDYVLNSRAGGDMHSRNDSGGVNQKATLIESIVFTPEKIEKMGLPEDYRHAWWIGLQVHDPDLWAEVRDGKKTKFSIHGVGHRTEVLVND